LESKIIMHKIFTRFIVFIFLCSGGWVVAQSNPKIDSLEKILPQTTDTTRVKVLLDLARRYQRINITKGMEYAQMAKTEAEKNNDRHGEALALRAMASIFQDEGDMPKAEKLAFLAQEQLEIYGTLTERADATNLLGLIFMGEAKYYQAEKYYKDALYYYIDTDDSVGVVIALHNIGVVNFYRGEYDVVARYYSSSLKLAEQIKQPKFIAINQLNLGLLYSAQKDYLHAKHYIKTALHTLQETGDKLGEGGAWAHLGNVYFNEGIMDSSYVCNIQALTIYREVGSEHGISQCLSNLGDIMMEKNQYQVAKKYYEESIQLRRVNEDTYGMAISLTGLANVYYVLGNPGLAEQYYDSALTISKSIGTIVRTGEVYAAMAQFQASQGNYKKAFEALQNYSAIEDTVYNQERLKVVNELNAKYETEKTQRELEIQKGKVSILKRANNLFTLSVVALAIILVLLVLLGITWRKRTTLQNQKNLEIAEKNRLLAESHQKATQAELERAKLEQEKMLAELQFKKKELTQLALHINQQNDFMESLKNNLKDAGTTPEVKSLERELDAKINLDKQREDFDMNIDLINEDFYRKLMERFPQLTENDKKLCAMLRLNLSSKEIAAIQNISSKSVDMNRYRLRKKLELNNEDDIVKFLSGI
jgi:tetratricopeptide (TPR) repeat protein